MSFNTPSLSLNIRLTHAMEVAVGSTHLGQHCSELHSYLFLGKFEGVGVRVLCVLRVVLRVLRVVLRIVLRYVSWVVCVGVLLWEVGKVG